MKIIGVCPFQSSEFLPPPHYLIPHQIKVCQRGRRTEGSKGAQKALPCSTAGRARPSLEKYLIGFPHCRTRFVFNFFKRKLKDQRGSSAKGVNFEDFQGPFIYSS